MPTSHYDPEIDALLDQLLARDPGAQAIGRAALLRIVDAVHLRTPLHPDRVLPTGLASSLIGIDQVDFIDLAASLKIKPRRVGTAMEYWRVGDVYSMRRSLSQNLETDGANDDRTITGDPIDPKGSKGKIRRIK
jgi:hypothetical protein